MSSDSTVWNLNQDSQGAQCPGMPLGSWPVWGTGKQALLIRDICPGVMALTQVGTRSSRALRNLRWGLAYVLHT